jgi:hypothetical protein
MVVPFVYTEEEYKELEEEKQQTRVEKPKNKLERSLNQEKVNLKLQLTDSQIKKKNKRS